jgi:TPR repeat protein
MLRRAATAGDPRAVELLAWCTLRGIGTGRDPLQAYFLYGKAASLDVPHARENQTLVYERSLSSGDRERILEMEAAPPPAPGILSAADEAPRHAP